MKLCSRCGAFKALDSFVKSSFTKSGYQAHCLECERLRTEIRRMSADYRRNESLTRRAARTGNLEAARAKDRRSQRQNQAFVNQLKAGPCKDCGKTFHPSAMDFDHVRGEKVRGIGQMVSANREALLAEIAKCDLVCANCHRIRTDSRHPLVTNRHRARFYRRIDALKSVPCLDCGVQFAPEAMDFDHVIDEKVASISQLRSRAWAVVIAELAKCELVCANCHRVRTWNRKQPLWRAA